MTNAKNALFKKLLIFACSVSVVTLCKPANYGDTFPRNKREEQVWNAGVYSGIFVTCVVGYQVWKWHSSVVESIHKEAITRLQTRLTAAEADKDAAQAERRDAIAARDAAIAEPRTLRQRLAESERMRAEITDRHKNLKLVYSGLEELHNHLKQEYLELQQQHMPKPIPSAPLQEDVEIAPPAYPGKPL